MERVWPAISQAVDKPSMLHGELLCTMYVCVCVRERGNYYLSLSFRKHPAHRFKSSLPSIVIAKCQSHLIIW